MDILDNIINIAAPIFLFGMSALIVIAFIRSIYRNVHKINDWVTTTAVMTGKTSLQSYKARGGARYTFTEYEIIYHADGKTFTKYFNFYPGPDPQPPYPQGTVLSIRYRLKRPQVFEVLDVIG